MKGRPRVEKVCSWKNDQNYDMKDKFDDGKFMGPSPSF
jgi:hypothetical protein